MNQDLTVSLFPVKRSEAVNICEQCKIQTIFWRERERERERERDLEYTLIFFFYLIYTFAQRALLTLTTIVEEASI